MPEAAVNLEALESKSPLEVFADSVANDIAGIRAQEGTFGFDPAAIAQLIIAIMQAVMQNCPQNKERMRKAVKNPSRIQQAAWTNRVKDHLDCCAESRWKGDVREISQTVMAKTAALSDKDLDLLMDDAARPDHSLI